MSLEAIQNKVEQLGKSFVGLVQEVRGLQDQQAAEQAEPQPKKWLVTAFGLKEPKTFSGELLPYAFCAGEAWARTKDGSTHEVTDAGLARMRQVDRDLLTIVDVKPIDPELAAKEELERRKAAAVQLAESLGMTLVPKQQAPQAQQASPSQQQRK